MNSKFDLIVHWDIYAGAYRGYIRYNGRPEASLTIKGSKDLATCVQNICRKLTCSESDLVIDPWKPENL